MSSATVLDDVSHRRYNILRGTSILVSPHRTKRPWQGQQESPSTTSLPSYDPKCYLCPGNKRAQGDVNPKYTSTYAFVNDFSAVKEEQAEYVPDATEDELESTFLQVTTVTGKCYVLTFSSAHNVTLADLKPQEIVPIVNAWTDIYRAHVSPDTGLIASPPPMLSSILQHIEKPREQYRYMQIFENKGQAMGCSNPHPHGQIWTTSTLPEEMGQELTQLKRYRNNHQGRHMLADYAKLETRKQERLVFENEAFIVICPWWAVWPFETLVVSKQHRRSLLDLTGSEREQLAEAISEVTRRYDNLFETQFPYSMGIHQAPLYGTAEEIEASHLHFHFYPPLLRSATVRKFLVGYELLAEPQRDLTPEQAAAHLRKCGGQLYRHKLEAS